VQQFIGKAPHDILAKASAQVLLAAERYDKGELSEAEYKLELATLNLEANNQYIQRGYSVVPVPRLPSNRIPHRVNKRPYPYHLKTDQQVARAQAYLLALGYDAGPIDGSYGLRTKAAIESFQRDHNLRVDGAVTTQLVAALAALHKGGREPSRAEGDGIDLAPWRALAGLAPSAQLTEKLDPSDVFKRVEGAIWKVVTLKGGTEHQGSAVAVTKDNLITNCHILDGGGRVSIIRQNREVPVKLIAGDKESDRCVVQASQPLDTYVRGVRPFAGLKIGERVYAVGSPRGLDLTLSEGIISGLRTGSKSRYIQTTAPISPGSSGGGLFDEGGNLIGITTFRIKKSQSLNFALAADEYWK